MTLIVRNRYKIECIKNVIYQSKGAVQYEMILILRSNFFPYDISNVTIVNFIPKEKDVYDWANRKLND